MADIMKIETVAALEGLLEQSRERPVWVFKHSLTCPISSMAWDEFRRFAVQEDEAICAFIEIQRARPVSNALAERTGVRHESPQAILLRDARAAWHASHNDIHLTALQRA